MNITKEEKNDIWQELIEEAQSLSKEKRKNEKTIKEFSEECGLSLSKSCEFLRKKHADGKLNRRWIHLNGKNVLAYSKKK